MATLNIVGVDFQLWFGGHAGIACEAEVTIGLVGRCLLCALVDDDFSHKRTASLFVEYALVKFVAVAVWYKMLDKCIVVNILLAVDEVKSEQVGVGMFAVETHTQVVAYDSAVKRQHKRFDICIALQFSKMVAYEARLVGFVLNCVVREL